MADFGKYEFVYKATYDDITENFTQIVHYGKVSLKENEIEKVSYGVGFEIPFEFNEFSIDDFNITYTINANLTPNQYTQENGIILKMSGYATIKLKLIHKINPNLIFEGENFEYKVNNITDDVAPTITLKGEETINLFVGQNFDDPLYETSDNNENSNIDVSIVYFLFNGGNYSKVNSIDVNKNGSYKIVYTAKDDKDNKSSVERFVKFSYAKITNISIAEGRLLSKYSQGQKITINLNLECAYTPNPNIYIIWYINGEELKRTYGDSVSLKFDNEGTYTISAQMLNNEEIKTQEIEIEIYKKSPYETVVLIGGIIVGAITVFGFIAFFANKYRKRNFY